MSAVITESTTTDRYYSPAKVRALLVLYPYLADAKPPTDTDLQLPMRRAFGPGGWKEEALAKKADISRALNALSTRRAWAGDAMRLRYCVGLPLRAIAEGLSRSYGIQLSHETVRVWTVDGIQFMSDYLCGKLIL
ncbi:MAG TPA: hypothetical protein VKU87_08930 [Thermomicrobiaceae bacterium]|nr:hypothetical protein [Thermomicrobiaceae bacterium]